MLSLLLLTLFLSCSCGKHVGNVYPFVVPDATYNVLQYGAKGDGRTDDTKAIQDAFNAARNGGTVQFPSGNYLTYPFSFSGSNTILNLNSGANILANTDKSKWPGGSSPMPFINAAHLNNLGITGKGTINGQGSAWWGHASSPRPGLLVFSSVTRVFIQGVSFINSANHNLELYSPYTEIDGVTITAPGNSPNTDGIDLHGEPFYIHGSKISVGDDNVAIHVSNVLIENCHFGTGHGASIGSIASGNYNNITIRGITFDGTVAGARIKTDSGATGSISGVTYHNLTLNNVETAIVIDMFYEKQPPKHTTMKISDITFSNIEGSATNPGSMKCQPSSPCKNIKLNTIRISTSKPWACEAISGPQTSVTPSSCISPS